MGWMLLLLLCLLAGFVWRLSGRFDDAAPVALNSYVINIALPALALKHLHRTELTATLVASAASAWLMLGAAALVIAWIARRLRLSPAATGALILTGGLANTSFVGLPMIEAWIGPQGLPYGIVIDQLGSYLALSTFGLLVAARYSGQAIPWREMVKRIATFPPLIAVVVAFALRGVEFAPALSDALARLSASVAPVALVAVGSQLRLSDLWPNRSALALGLGYKLLLGPLLIATVCLLINAASPDSDFARTVVIFEAAMGPMIGAAVVAGHFKLDTRLTALMVGVGIPASLLIAPLWLAVAHGIA